MRPRFSFEVVSTKLATESMAAVSNSGNSKRSVEYGMAIKEESDEVGIPFIKPKVSTPSSHFLLKLMSSKTKKSKVSAGR